MNEKGKAEVVLQGDAITGFWCLIQSPDGRRAIVGEVVPGDNNVWMVDNFRVIPRLYDAQTSAG